MLRAVLLLATALALAVPAASCGSEPSCRNINDEVLESTLIGMNSGKVIWIGGDREANKKCARVAMGKALDTGRALSDSMMAAMTQITYDEGWNEFEPNVDMFLQAERSSGRVASMHALAKSAPKFLERRLAELLASESSDVRVAAAEQGAKAGERKHIARITELYLTSRPDAQKSYRQALIDLRAGNELAETIAARPDKAPALLKLMSESSDDLQPLLGLLRHKDPRLRATAVAWLGGKTVSKSGELRDAFGPELNDSLHARLSPKASETDAAIMSALAVAASDVDANVAVAAQKAVQDFCAYDSRQPTLITLFETELAKPESKLVVGLCYGISYSSEGAARLKGLSKSKDKALKRCAKSALKAINAQKRVERDSKR